MKNQNRKIQGRLILLSFLAVLAPLLPLVAHAVKPVRKPDQTTGRMSLAEIRKFITETQENMKKERRFENRRPHLKNAMDVLNIEFNKGVNVGDKLFFEVNRIQLAIEFLLNNDCKKSLELLTASTSGSGGSARDERQNREKIAEDLRLYKAYCQDD